MSTTTHMVMKPLIRELFYKHHFFCCCRLRPLKKSSSFITNVVINIGKGEQFTSGFVSVNPNSKIPALVDRDGPGGTPISLFESASINLYLCEKYNRFIPSDPRQRVEVFNWVFWQMAGQGPITGGGFGHFFAYAPPDKVCVAKDRGSTIRGTSCLIISHSCRARLKLVTTALLALEWKSSASAASWTSTWRAKHMLLEKSIVWLTSCCSLGLTNCALATSTLLEQQLAIF